MEMEQELEWNKAQSVVINVDLVTAAKRHLEFLAAIDRNRWLYDGPALDIAIYRYNVYWLPLLAKHLESPLLEGPLVVPLDCEWIWHCHRLNPVRYKMDCVELYGSILDNRNVLSSVGGISSKETEEIWKVMYLDEPYELDSTRALSNNIAEQISGMEKCTKYDLISAVKRQSPFFYQVDRPHMGNDLYLEGAVARYKGFLHLIKRNKERSIKSFSVPTYDIDLIWHTHQLHPAAYCNDLVDIMGKVLEHDDTDSDRTKGMKLDLGFSGTTKQWEEIYGLRYWRAGAMYKGTAPSPLRTTPYPSLSSGKKNFISQDCHKILDLPAMKFIEVMLEFVEVKNLPEGHKGSLFVSFSKTEPDKIFNTKRRLTILSESGEKQVACFQCQPTGNLLFELICLQNSILPLSNPSKTMGSGSISLEDLLSPSSKLTVEKWLDLEPGSETLKPINLRVAVSVTVPTPAPNVLNMIRFQPFLKNSCFFQLPGKIQLTKNWTRVIDENGNVITNLQMRDFKKSKGKNDNMLRKEVIGITESGGKHRFAEFTGTEWILMDSHWSLKLPGTVHEDGSVLEVTGDYNVKIFPGRKIDYEPKCCDKQRNDNDFMTAAEFSAENPYGRAVALFDLKFGITMVKEDWFSIPGFTLAFIIGEIMRKEGKNSLISSCKTLKEKGVPLMEVDGSHLEGNETNLTTVQGNMKLDLGVSQGNAVTLANGGTQTGGCGGCGGGCGSDVRSGACGGCGNCGTYGAKSENKLESSACGGCGAGCSGGCGGGCGDMSKKASGGGCGGSGGCGSSGGCGGCGGGSGGCGSGGSCGNKLVDGNNTAKDPINDQGKVRAA